MQVINLDFTMFNIEYHASCNYDFLQIHDGSSASSHQIGKFCGNLTQSVSYYHISVWLPQAVNAS